jgi:hypothetical protein
MALRTAHIAPAGHEANPQAVFVFLFEVDSALSILLLGWPTLPDARSVGRAAASWFVHRVVLNKAGRHQNCVKGAERSASPDSTF